MSEDVGQRLTALEGEIAHLNRKLKSLFNIIDTSTDKEPFMRLMVSVDATEAQETAIYDLMGEVDDALAQAKPTMDYVAFCDRVYQVFPDHSPAPPRRVDRHAARERRRVGKGLRAPPRERHEAARPARRARVLGGCIARGSRLITRGDKYTNVL